MEIVIVHSTHKIAFNVFKHIQAPMMETDMHTPVTSQTFKKHNYFPVVDKR